MAKRAPKFVSLFLATFWMGLTGCGGGAAERDFLQEARVEIAKAVERSYPEADAPARDPDRPGEYYVAADGSPTGDGSAEQPWSLHHVLSGAAGLVAGETVWLRGGEYEGPFVSELIGALGAPIIVRGFPQERVTLTGCDDAAVLTVNGQYTWMWGFEVTGCGGARTTDTPGSHPDEFASAAGVDVFGSDIKIIELEVHDAPSGIGCWAGAKRAQLIGNLIYYNGWDGPDRGHGHGIYVQNDVGTKYVTDNVIFRQFGNGIHAYAEDAPLNNLSMTGNVSFMNGQLSKTTGLRYNLLVGGDTVVRNALIERNFTYFPVDEGGANNFGYAGGCQGLNALANYFVGGTALRVNKCEDLELSKNTLFGKVEGLSEERFPDNTFLEEAPARPAVILRDYGWSERQALLIVYNWQGDNTIQVDLNDGKYHFGQRLAVRSIENLSADPRIVEREEGALLDLSMSGWSVRAPVQADAPSSTLPYFGVFVIEDAPAS